ncbi:hypothetical protein EW145_g990 [Phellinidium pouzarii]|uniref:Uncharacterized protein n=1 Tax=Phellinidium pouzarii TaxID=167371 RepID=A0A4S4LG71_9AGAM|nr:hypothetical protein EW145_g990 [Phellinidium pouzarii]
MSDGIPVVVKKGYPIAWAVEAEADPSTEVGDEAVFRILWPDRLLIVELENGSSTPGAKINLAVNKTGDLSQLWRLRRCPDRGFNELDKVKAKADSGQASLMATETITGDTSTTTITTTTTNTIKTVTTTITTVATGVFRGETCFFRRYIYALSVLIIAAFNQLYHLRSSSPVRPFLTLIMSFQVNSLYFLAYSHDDCCLFIPGTGKETHTKKSDVGSAYLCTDQLKYDGSQENETVNAFQGTRKLVLAVRIGNLAKVFTAVDEAQRYVHRIIREHSFSPAPTSRRRWVLDAISVVEQGGMIESNGTLIQDLAAAEKAALQSYATSKTITFKDFSS